MTTRAEIRTSFKAQVTHDDGVYCTYCHERKPDVALYRVHEASYNGERRDTIHAVCTDSLCVEKATTSRVKDKWKRW